VRHEHIASVGSIETPLSVANRVAFWQIAFSKTDQDGLLLPT
jgi:hypothetical protein